MEANQKQKFSRVLKITSIKKAINECLSRGTKPNREFLLMEVASKLKTSRRTANEFMKIALWELQLDKNFNKITVQEKLDYAE